MNHSFNIYYAKRYGLNEAIMISNFQFWIAKNKANGSHQYDERTWTYNSVKAFEELFPYMTSSQIRRCLESLVEQEVLIKGEYNKNPYDRTSWYAFNDENAFLIKQLDLSNLTNGDYGNDNSHTDGKPKSKEKLNKKKRERKEFVPPTVEEMIAYFVTNNKDPQKAKDAFNYYNNFGWKDKNGSKVENWKQKMHGTWFRNSDISEFNRSLKMSKEQGDDQMHRFLQKGLDVISGEELEWIYDWQHRTSDAYLQYSEDIRVVGRTTRKTKAQCREEDRKAGYGNY